MSLYTPYLKRLDHEAQAMRRLLATWADVGSGSRNIPGLDAMLSHLCEAFAVLEGDVSGRVQR